MNFSFKNPAPQSAKIEFGPLTPKSSGATTTDIMKEWSENHGFQKNKTNSITSLHIHISSLKGNCGHLT